MSALPSWLIEASNGTLIVVLLWMVLFDVRYLVLKVSELGGAKLVASEWWMTKSPPAELKGAVALLTLLTGFWLRTFGLWWFRHMEAHGIDTLPFREIGIALLVGGTIISVWGGMCWLKVILPTDIPRFTWFILCGSALGFGFGMVLA